jgi:thiol-disulfide isomerase/thioredoxin
VNRRLQTGVFLLVAVLAGTAGFYLNRGSVTSPVTDGAAKRLMLASLPDPRGKSQTMSQWRGKILVVNFWATWCAPCREEIPGLINMQHKYAANGVQFVGIALDNVANVLKFIGEMRIDYALLIGGTEALSLTKELGNRAGVLPFTVVLGRDGEVAYTHAGALTEASLSAALTPLL